jgi:hypothetical protein
MYSPNIIRIITSRRIRWAEHVASMEEVRDAYRLLVGKPKCKRPLGRPRLDGRMLSKLILKEQNRRSLSRFLAQDRNQ